MPKFSIIMQSYLGDYPGAAKDREKKFIRAIDSCINQIFEDWELIIVSDGCEKTFELASNLKDNRVSCYFIPKQPIWSGTARDIGKLEAKGDYCLYLDTDDYYSKEHLESISSQLGNHDWVFYDDFIWVNNNWKVRVCNIKRIGQNGTSNVCFKRELNVSWSVYTGYAHDYFFNQQLVKQYPNCAKINNTGYYVCHLPEHPGGKGYDI